MADTQRILVITDCSDVAAIELHATLVSNLDRLGAEHVTVEPVAVVKEFSILHGSFVARLLAESYMSDRLTILAVVNPLDTTNAKRARIAGTLGNGIKIVGANTGIFSWLIKDFGLREIVETNSTGLRGDGFISFGGKHIHAPIAAKLASINDINSVKEKHFAKKDLVTLNYKEGTIVHIDNFGVSKILYEADQLSAKNGDKFKVYVDDRAIGEATYCMSMKELPNGTFAIYKGSSLGLLELGVVRKLDAARELGLEIGDLITLKAI